MPSTHPPYRGRFAPSPTGPLHLGSLIAALASYLDARNHDGAWLVRMEDLDPPREEQGAAKRILDSLQKHGLHWDEQLVFQSQRGPAYAAALKKLHDNGQLFTCDCSRQMLDSSGACRGHCRERQGDFTAATASRVMVPPDTQISFQDQIQGPQQVPLGTQTQDFIVKRKDGLDAYQLAVVVDDAWQRITHIVRGSDLLDTTPRQVYLQGLLAYATPHYSHIPVVTNASGQKLSKQNHAPPLDDAAPAANIRKALAFLRQDEPPAALESASSILEFASRHWAPEKIPARLSIPYTTGA